MLGGSGFSWQDEQVYELRPGDCVVHLADHEEHTLRGGPDGLEVLICGTRHPTEMGWLPRSRAIRLGWPWVEGRTDDPWDIEAAGRAARVRRAGAAADRTSSTSTKPRPRRRRRSRLRASNRYLAARPGRSGPGCGTRSSPKGSSTVRRTAMAQKRSSSSSWTARDVPPGTRRVPSGAGRSSGARQERASLTPSAGRSRCSRTGREEPNEICYYPRSKKIAFWGVGVVGRIESLDYWDGEPPG